ncbi:molybdate ABC transporter substrate-binding protein [Costertonia aggregata]|uniref:Molybdate ABC transporter substrate-binding protein n=1 Tax=Costertonia aggregata TaxID=343403 RepID=A0A7H9ANC2_9FLAO|nr:molybdate ABC transporter substrate-binding protein [Costertonia aggregata]
MGQIAKKYKKEYGIRVDVQYGGSGTLLSNLRVANQGDLYIAADESYVHEAIVQDLVGKTQSLADIVPVIAVAKGNPKGLMKIDDLFTNGLKVAIANPDAASIGRLTKKIFMEEGYWDMLQNNITVQMFTVNEVANTVKLGTADVGVIWDATANQYDEIDIVPIPEFEKYASTITAGVLNFSDKKDEALKFMMYMAAMNKGLKVFDSIGYRPISKRFAPSESRKNSK